MGRCKYMCNILYRYIFIDVRYSTKPLYKLYIYIFENPYMLTLHSYIYIIYIYTRLLHRWLLWSPLLKAYVLDREGRPESEVPLLALLSKPMQRELRFARYEGCLREIGFSRYLSHCTWVRQKPRCSVTHTHDGSMYGIYDNIWGILMVNVTIYSIHGSYGIGSMVLLEKWCAMDPINIPQSC